MSSVIQKIAIYPGTFDPITKGHVNLIERAAHLFDEIIIGVAVSLRKTPLFDLEKRMRWCENSLKQCANVRVFSIDHLTADFAKSYQAQYLLRGIRTADDVDYELSIASMNRVLSKNQLETVFLSSLDEYRFISATIVREIISLKGDVSAFVPECVLRDL